MLLSSVANCPKLEYDFFIGIIEELDGNLEFDCSSQEISDSENNEEGVDYSVGGKTHCKTPRSKRKATFAKDTVCEESLTKSSGSKALGISIIFISTIFLK